MAIPVRNEAERIGACLRSLARQRGAKPHAVVLLLNNCTDATGSIVRGLARSLKLPLHPVVATLPANEANAGTARSLAMEQAAALAGPDGVLLTTDADSVAPPHWLAANLACLARGVDAVAGRAVIDPVEARRIPAALHEADARECAYAACLDEIASLLDPDPADPWPRHTEASGASIAVTVRAWTAVGGMEPLPLGEDRAFIAALLAHDMTVRHAPEVWMTVSGRIYGRAAGGMADTIRRRLVRPDQYLDERLETAPEALRRLRLRRAARALHGAAQAGPGAAERLAGRLCLPAVAVRQALSSPWFGAAWLRLEQDSPVLARRAVPVAALPREMARATALLRRLRAADAGAPVHPAGSAAAPVA